MTQQTDKIQPTTAPFRDVPATPLIRSQLVISIITILLLLFFLPAGILVMWVWPKWNRWVKIAITAVPILAVGAYFSLYIPDLIGL